jgi:hypothetical protein
MTADVLAQIGKLKQRFCYLTAENSKMSFFWEGVRQDGAFVYGAVGYKVYVQGRSKGWPGGQPLGALTYKRC